MQILLKGPIDGNIQSIYEDATPETLCVVSTGSMGVWPDPHKLDRGTRNKVGHGEFSSLYLTDWQAPIQTFFIEGVHEDHRWLKQCLDRGQIEILPNIHWLCNGAKTDISDWDEALRITGLGKVYSESTFNGKFNKKSHRHFTRREFERACSSGPTDLLVLHQNPDEVLPLKKVIFATRPKLVVCSARDNSYTSHIQNTPVWHIAKGDSFLVDYKSGIFQLQ